MRRVAHPRAGGPGPRIESWAYAVDDVGLRVLIAELAFALRTCKMCKGAEDGIIGEWVDGWCACVHWAGHAAARAGWDANVLGSWRVHWQAVH